MGCHRDPGLGEMYALVRSQGLLESRLRALAHQVSDANLQQMPDFQQRVEVLRHLDYIAADNTVQLKVVCLSFCLCLSVSLSVCRSVSGWLAGWLAVLLIRSSCELIKQHQLIAVSLPCWHSTHSELHGQWKLVLAPNLAIHRS